MQAYKPFILSLFTLLLKNCVPFVLTWTVANYFTTDEFNQIFTTLAAVGFVSAAGSLNMLFTAQSLYGDVAGRSNLEYTFYDIFILRFIIFFVLGYLYFTILSIEGSIYIYILVLFVRMIFDFTYALLKITERFQKQLIFVFLNLLCISVIPVLILGKNINTNDILLLIVLSEIIPIIFILTFHHNLIKMPSIRKWNLGNLSIFLPGMRLLGLSLFLPLLNNTLYVRMVHLDHYDAAESFNFAMKIGLAYATIFSVFSNYLIQTTDWKSLDSHEGKKKIHLYAIVGVALISFGSVSLYFIPLNDILFSRERFANLDSWSFLTVLICCLIMSISLLNQIRLQMNLIRKYEWIGWIIFSIFNYLICYYTLVNTSMLQFAFATVACVQILTVIYMLYTFHCFFRRARLTSV